MAGMFYSLEEAAEKLHKSEAELKEIVKEGKLREFRDGPNILFKVEEVEALLSEEAIAESEALPEPEFEAEPEGLSEAESEELPEPEFEAEPEEIPEPELEADLQETSTSPSPEPEIPELEDQEPETIPASEEDLDLDEILLAPETGAPALPNDLTDADTALTGQGTSVLGQTDKDYDITDDTMADTVIPPETSSEVPLEEIEEDVNLDTFGSGSGLLDLSLQADDTSLGGILDEIYTAEGEGPEISEADSEAAAPPEAGPVIAEEELLGPQPTSEIPTLAAPLIELAPDKQSNILGSLLFLPLVFIIYTLIVAVAALGGVVPSIQSSIQDFIWYIAGAAIVATGIVAGASFMLGGERGTKVKAPKAKKEKKPKKEKVAKVKKPKKEKKPKPPKK